MNVNISITIIHVGPLLHTERVAHLEGEHTGGHNHDSTQAHDNRAHIGQVVQVRLQFAVDRRARRSVGQCARFHRKGIGEESHHRHDRARDEQYDSTAQCLEGNAKTVPSTHETIVLSALLLRPRLPSALVLVLAMSGMGIEVVGNLRVELREMGKLLVRIRACRKCGTR